MAALAADRLPAIRPELRLVGRRRDVSGTEVGVVYDPLRHRFFELGPAAAAMLLHWRCGSRAALAARAGAAPEDVEALLRFLAANQLLKGGGKARPPGGFARIEHAIGKLFFFRIPLLHPDRALDRLSEVLAPLLGRGGLAALVAVALAGLLLVGRQWDLFLQGFRPVFHLDGALALTAAVLLAKAVHELGHALAAKRLGCAVPAMGVAVMFGAPLLYTDLSDTWRLGRRRDRLLVASGGILAETLLAALATWGWLVLPDGPARGACFFLMTAAWTATLLVNANPFMRFDGYFMLSDALGVPNLQERAFALGRWRLRRLLFGGAEPCPDEAPPGMRLAMTAYAWSTWAFRGSLYLGLAWMAFQLLPKVLAVPLLAAELWVLVARPVVHELAAWWRSRRELLGTRRGRTSALLFAGLALWLVVPQSWQMSLPAVLAPAERQWINPPRAARLAGHAAEGATVAAGEVLAAFADPELDHQLAQTRLRLAMLRMAEEQAARSLRSARELAVIAERIAGETATLSGLEAQREALTVRAPFAGRVVDAATGLADGAWYGPGEPLFLLASAAPPLVTAYVDDRGLDLLAAGGTASFHPTPVDFPVRPAVVGAVETIPAEVIGEPLLASLNGGPIATERDALGRAVPRQGQYRVTARLAEDATGDGRAIGGRLMVDSKPYSLLGLILRRLQALAVKEASG